MKRVSRREGFTLTEILAVLVILALITVSLFTIFHQGTETWRQAKARTEAFIKARQVLDMMAREMRSAVVITAASGPKANPENNRVKRADFVGMDESDLKPWRKDAGAGDQVYFVAPMATYPSDAAGGLTDLCILGYWLKAGNDKTGETGILMRSYLNDSGYASPTDVWKEFDFSSPILTSIAQPIASGVRSFDVKYYRQGDRELKDIWHSLPFQLGGITPKSYDDNRLPDMVRVTLTIGDDRNVLHGGITLTRTIYLEKAGR